MLTAMRIYSDSHTTIALTFGHDNCSSTSMYFKILSFFGLRLSNSVPYFEFRFMQNIQKKKKSKRRKKKKVSMKCLAMTSALSFVGIFFCVTICIKPAL